MSALVDLIAGARPNFMKVAPIIRVLERRQENGVPWRYRLIHTGQHYDAQMSGQFFEQLGIPEPSVNLEVGSGTQAGQAAAIMTRYEALLLRERADICVVVGDVNSTMACAIAAQKLNVPVAHVEAGIRSGDWSMPEEINRMVTDAISNWYFTTSRTANSNLRKAGVSEERIYFVGNTMIDSLIANLERLRPPGFVSEFGLQKGAFFVVTLHRPANVDAVDSFAELLTAIGRFTRGLPVVFPVHPRTRKTLERVAAGVPNVRFVAPQPYLEFNWLVKHCKAVITDSGGITEEATVLGVPCLTLRDTTERPETIDVGTNELIGTEPANLEPALERVFAGKWKKGAIPELWDGRSAERIVSVLEKLLVA